MRCQQELYAAERRVASGREILDANDLQRYVDGLRENPWWGRTVPQVRRIEVVSDRRLKTALGSWYPEKSAGLIEFGPDRHRNELRCLHEVAHVLATARTGEDAAHGPAFARSYLELVAVYMGPDTYEALRSAFDAEGIEHEWDFGLRLGTAREMRATS